MWPVANGLAEDGYPKFLGEGTTDGVSARTTFDALERGMLEDVIDL